jgi:hypothetical protein
MTEWNMGEIEARAAEFGDLAREAADTKNKVLEVNNNREWQEYYRQLPKLYENNARAMYVAHRYI